MDAPVTSTQTAAFAPGGGRRRSLVVRALPHVLALALAVVLVVAVPRHWNAWVGAAGWQETDDAATRGDLTPISARVAGYVRRVGVSDYQHVHAGDLLVEIADDDYRAQVAQAQANVDSAVAAIANNLAQQALQQANIRAADAGIGASQADLVRHRLESNRQRILVTTSAASHQTVEQAEANERRTEATVEQMQAQAEAQRRQLDVLQTQARQLVAALAAQNALLELAKINLGYTRILAPADGMVGERQVRPGQLVASGTQVIAVVPLPDVWVVANFKETQLTHAAAGQRAEVTVDTYPGTVLHGRIDTIAPASGSQFALLPPDNATGNFTKVVQRVPVKIVLEADNPLRDRLRPGLSVTARIDTGDAAAPGK